MKVELHLDVEKVAMRDLEKYLRIARLQGKWTSANSLKHQADWLGASETMIHQFDVHIERIEAQLVELGAVIGEEAA